MHDKEITALAHKGGQWTRSSLLRTGFTGSMISEAIRVKLLESKPNGTFEVAARARLRIVENDQMQPGDTVMRVVNGELKQFQVVGQPDGSRISLVDPEDPHARVEQVNQADAAAQPSPPSNPGEPLSQTNSIPAMKPQNESKLVNILEGKPWEDKKDDEEGDKEEKPEITESEVPVGEPPADVAGQLALRMAQAYKDWESGRAASPSADDWVITLGELVNKPDIMRYGGEDLSDFVYDLLNDGCTIKRAARLLFRRYQQRHPKLESKSLAERLLEAETPRRNHTPSAGPNGPISRACICFEASFDLDEHPLYGRGDAPTVKELWKLLRSEVRVVEQNQLKISNWEVEYVDEMDGYWECLLVGEIIPPFDLNQLRQISDQGEDKGWYVTVMPNGDDTFYPVDEL